MQETRQRGFLARLLRSLFFIITSYLALLGLGVTLLGILVGVVIYKQFDGHAAMPQMTKVQQIGEASILRIKLDRPLTMGSIAERTRIFAQLFDNPLPIAVDDLQVALRRAAADTRVKAVLLDVESTAGDLSTVTALRRSLEQFVSSQKPLYVHLSEGDSSLYYLASIGSKINLSPVGGLTIPGPSLQLTYFGSALAKLGVTLEVVKAGKYKSAMEAFIQDQPSPETTEVYQALEGSLRDTLVQAIAAGRKRPAEEVAGWLKRSLFTSQQAQAQGLVDRIGYLTDWEGEVQKATEGKAWIELDDYLDGSEALDDARSDKGDSTLALIEAEGEIVMSGSGSGQQITPKDMIEELRWARDDDKIKAVVLRIDSPGGSALASDLIWDEVNKLAAKKPLIVSMGSVAASGGYYIAAPASMIFAEATTITGSIGVIGAIPKGLQVAEKWGVNFHIITGSDRRNYMNFGTPSSVEDKAILGESIKETYDTFVNKVAMGRKQTPEKIYSLAEGRVYSGIDAQKIGLVDRLGGLRDAMQAAKELGKLDPEKLYAVQRYRPEATSLIDCLGEENVWQCVNELRGAHLTLPLQLSMLDSLQRIDRLLHEQGPLTFWPGQVSWGSHVIQEGRGL